MKTLFLATMLACAFTGGALALTFDQNVTPDVIFGDGNANGAFTVDAQTTATTTIEIGLRGKLRFDSNNQPQNVFGSNGDGSYSFVAGAAPTGFPWQPGATTTPVWNFEFAVNVDQDGTGGATLDDFTYELGLDFDPSPPNAAYLVFDPITPAGAAPDHSLGDNTTTEATDVIAADATEYATFAGIYNVAQNSWNYEFFNDAPFDTFDPAVDGVYDIYLKVFENGVEVAHTAISIVVGNAVSTENASWGQVKALFR